MNIVDHIKAKAILGLATVSYVINSIASKANADGSNATGQWPINITGGASTANSAVTANSVTGLGVGGPTLAAAVVNTSIERVGVMNQSLNITGNGELIRLRGLNNFVAFYNVENTVRSGYIQYSSGFNVVAEGVHPIMFGTAASFRWSIESSGHLVPFNDNAYDLGSTASRVRTTYTRDINDATAVNVIVGGATQLTVTAAMSTYKGLEIGHRKLIRKTYGAGVTLDGEDHSKLISLDGAGIFTIAAGVYAAGSVLNIYNNSGANCTIRPAAGLTMQFNTGAVSLGDKTLALNGYCSIVFQSASFCHIQGTGLS